VDHPPVLSGLGPGPTPGPGHELHGVDQRASRTYRADIDGLRALAVLPIVIFHLGVKKLSGGFIGVDIFFVISGYLIGGPLLNQVFERRYSLADFYARRFRRIVPALAVTLAATTLAMWFVGLPVPMVDYARSLIAAMLSVSNIFFWNSAGYFDPAADSKPLLHTWSLGVEEQFYLLFPLIVLATRGAGRRGVITILAVIAAVSFAASCWGVKAEPTATFYLLHTRIWELLIGVLASQIPAGLLKARGVREALAFAALAVVVGPMFLYTASTPFPGLAAAAPCLGTAVLLVVGAQGGSLVGRGFALSPTVFIGLISYSLYLWHWPVIVLLREGLPVVNLDAKLKLLALGLSLGLAWLSWRFVERPLRDPTISRTAIFGGTLAVAVAISAAGLAIISLQGLPGRLSPDAARLAYFMQYRKFAPHPNTACSLQPNAGAVAGYDVQSCLRVKPGVRNVLLMGDSHAGNLRSGLAGAYPDLNIRVATMSGCKPLLVRRAKFAECARLRELMYGDYLPRHPGGWVILSARWAAGDLNEAARAVDWLKAHGFNVILSGPVVTYRLPLSQLTALSAQRHDPKLPDRFRDPGAAKLDAAFAEVARRHGAIYMSPYRALCGGGPACWTVANNGAPVQWDESHLTYEGSLLVAANAPVNLIPVAR
jgi:peptidoglycan/LPS O-acetylase OafA/YrhL